MSLDSYKATLSKLEAINQRFLKLHFELNEPHRLSFQAGQYILLDIPGEAQKRQYSIASEPQMDHAIELLIDLEPQGIGSTYLSQLKLGDAIHFRAPLGVFIIDEEKKEEELVFVATGSGITPLRSMILDQLHVKNFTGPISLFWGMRYAEDLFWEEDFYAIDEEYENFSFELILSKPPATWHLSQGYVTDLLEAYQENYHKAGFYVCGSQNMVETVIQFLTDKNVSQDRIHHEKFY